MQPSLGDLGLAGIERDDRGVDEREQLSARRPTCYIATRARFPTILHRGSRFAGDYCDRFSLGASATGAQRRQEIRDGDDGDPHGAV